ncbi:MAG: hypothetical protein AVDCRST_MAG68-2836, partial [uncultured Gemmatimonadetes bacterium]
DEPLPRPAPRIAGHLPRRRHRGERRRAAAVARPLRSARAAVPLPVAPGGAAGDPGGRREPVAAPPELQPGALGRPHAPRHRHPRAPRHAGAGRDRGPHPAPLPARQGRQLHLPPGCGRPHALLLRAPGPLRLRPAGGRHGAQGRGDRLRGRHRQRAARRLPPPLQRRRPPRPVALVGGREHGPLRTPPRQL